MTKDTEALRDGNTIDRDIVVDLDNRRTRMLARLGLMLAAMVDDKVVVEDFHIHEMFAGVIMALGVEEQAHHDDVGALQDVWEHPEEHLLSTRFAALAAPASAELGFDPTAEVGDEIYCPTCDQSKNGNDLCSDGFHVTPDTIGSHFGNGGGLDPAAGDLAPDAWLYENKVQVFKYKEPQPDLINRGFTETACYYASPHPAPVDPAPDEMLRRAQEIVSIANGLHRKDADDEHAVPVRLIRAVAGVVNGEAFRRAGFPPVPVDPVAGGEALREALEAAEPNDIGGYTFDHSPDEIGIMVMENRDTILAALKGPAA